MYQSDSEPLSQMICVGLISTYVCMYVGPYISLKFEEVKVEFEQGIGKNITQFVYSYLLDKPLVLLL